MEVFRITHAKWAGILLGSGYPARWNSKGIFVCYTGSTRALSCLEMLVHLSGVQITTNFKITEIKIPDVVLIETAKPFLNLNWTEFENYKECQMVGDEWANSLRTCILKVPSAIIKNEYNYLINPHHPDFKLIDIVNIEDFEFDMRLKK